MQHMGFIEDMWRSTHCFSSALYFGTVILRGLKLQCNVGICIKRNSLVLCAVLVEDL